MAKLANIALYKKAGHSGSAVLGEIVYLARGKDSCIALQCHLASLIGRCIRTVQNALNRLVSLGLITIIGQNYINKNGHLRIRNTYIIHYDKILEIDPEFIPKKTKKQLPEKPSSYTQDLRLLLPLKEKEVNLNNITKTSVEQPNEEPSSKVSSVEEIKTFLEAEVGRLGAHISEVKKESLPEEFKNDLIGQIDLKRTVKTEIIQELNAYADLLPTMTKAEQKKLNRYVRAEFGHLRGMELPYNTELTQAWGKVMEDRGIHEDHREWVFSDFCQFWWEDVHETKINPISMNWFRVWERRITFLSNSCDWYRHPMTDAEYNRRMHQLMNEQEKMSGTFKKSLSGSIMQRMIKNASPKEKMLEEKPKSNIDDSILRILKRITDEDGANRAWMSWFMGNEVRIIQDNAEYNLCMKVGSSFKKDYIQTHYRDVVQALKIKIVA